MSILGHIVCSDAVDINGESGFIKICRAGDLFVATWECSCGAISDPLQAATLEDAVGAGKENYLTHSETVHY